MTLSVIVFFSFYLVNSVSSQVTQSPIPTPASHANCTSFYHENTTGTGIKISLCGGSDREGNLLIDDYPVCDKGWDDNAATVACRWLNPRCDWDHKILDFYPKLNNFQFYIWHSYNKLILWKCLS